MKRRPTSKRRPAAKQVLAWDEGPMEAAIKGTLDAAPTGPGQAVVAAIVGEGVLQRIAFTVGHAYGAECPEPVRLAARLMDEAFRKVLGRLAEKHATADAAATSKKRRRS